MDTVEANFCGVWRYARDENMSECLKSLKYPDPVINFVLESKPSMTVTRDGDFIQMVYEMMPGKQQVHRFKLNEEFESLDESNKENPMYHNKEICTMESDGSLKFVAKSLLPAPFDIDSETYFVRKGNELHNLLSKVGDRSITGNRVMVLDCGDQQTKQ